LGFTEDVAPDGAWKFLPDDFLQICRANGALEKTKSVDLKSCAGKIVAERHWKLARHKVPGQPSKNKIRPERTAENAPPDSSVPSGRIIFRTNPATS